MNKKELIKVFTDLGANDPEGWAASEIREGIPQLARFLFLKGCWDEIVSDSDLEWIENLISNVPEKSNEPLAGTAHALRRILASGASTLDISELVRGVQADFLCDILYVLADSRAVTGNKFVSWGLFEVDSDGNPKRCIHSLYESVLEMDPTGREMRPQNS